MPLTELQIKNVRPQPGKTVRVFDARGLYLEISETGRKWWRLKYRYAGKEKRLSLGVYPETSLKDARARCDEARKLLSDGVDPSQQRKVDRLVRAERSEDTFEKIGREWYAKQSEVWVPEHAARILSRYFPAPLVHLFGCWPAWTVSCKRAKPSNLNNSIRASFEVGTPCHGGRRDLQ